MKHNSHVFVKPKINTYSLKAFLLVMFVSLTVTSCYKIFKTHAPKEVTAGQQFDVKMVVVDNGDANQKEITDWSVAAIRVPEDWDVKCGAQDYRSYAEDWVYYSNGKPANAAYTLRYSESLSKAYDAAAPKSGYKWMAFVSATKVTKYMSSCWRNGCDSAVVTFHVTAGQKTGKYTLDFLAGDNEQDESPKSYSESSQLATDRMINASSVAMFKIPNGTNTSNYTPQAACAITVLEATDAITAVSDDKSKSSSIYDLEGRKVSDGNNVKNLPKGTYIINHQKTILK